MPQPNLQTSINCVGTHHDSDSSDQRDSRAVVDAAPGIVAYNDIPLILPRGAVPTSSGAGPAVCTADHARMS
jgi:hypothetical protein